jgi:hypothetical protein
MKLRINKVEGEIRMRMPSLHRISIGFLLAIWVTLFLSGLKQYPGSSGYYVAFSLVFLGMLGSGLCKRTTYAYLFLVVFLWLGFWLKLTAHQIFVYPYGEPVGLFDKSPASFDKVLLIAISGCLGVVLARIFYGWIGWKSTLTDLEATVPPPWYPRMQKVLWIKLIAVLISCAVINVVYGIQQSGLVPRTLLIWPLNAAIYWMLGSGFAMCVATLGCWHLASRGAVVPVAYIFLVSSTISTVSLLSRGLYIFHTVPAMLAIYENRERAKDLSPKRIAIYSVVFIVMMLVSLSLVSVLRGYYYSNVPPTLIELTDTTTSLHGAQSSLRFIVDRWVGVEGVMAVSSYNDKGLDLFIRALTEKSEIGRSTLYQQVCLAHYRFMDLSKFQFASLPGAIAFFYYTDSLPLVMLGMMTLTLLALCSEKMVSRLTANPLLSAFWGCAMANFIAQFGVAPRGLGPHFVMSLLAILTIWTVQSNYFTDVLYKTGLMKRAEI